MARILIADEVDGLKRLSAILESEELRFGHSFDEALFLLETIQFDLIVVGIYFDESRALELFRLTKTLELAKNTPLVFVRTQPSNRAAELKKTIQALGHVLNLHGFVETDLLGENDVLIKRALLAPLNSES